MCKPRRGRRSSRFVLGPLAGIAFLIPAASLHAADGKLEINQACVAEGCFPGDAAGFPVTITSPGSYILTSDLVLVTALGGIVVQADHVTLDLNGFGLTGTDDAWGIQLGANFVEIRNGYIRDFLVGIGPQTVGEDAMSSRVIGVRSTSNVTYGIRLGDDGMVMNCTVTDNGQDGILLGAFGTARGNVSSNNGNAGIEGGGGLVVRENVARDNGHDGIDVGGNSVVAGNTAASNNANGIQAGQGSVVVDNSANSNGGHGIDLVGTGLLVSGNSARFNQDHGIATHGDASARNHLVRGNVAYLNNLSAGGFADIQPCASCTLVENHTGL